MRLPALAVLIAAASWLTLMAAPPANPGRNAIRSHIDRSVPVNGTYAAVRLPIDRGIALRNPSAIAIGPGGAVYVANYTGEILTLHDSDGDGLEDTARLFANVRNDGKDHLNEDAVNYGGVPQGPGLRYPTAITFKGRDCYVATTQEIRVYRDVDGDGVSDESRRFAGGWPFTNHFWDWTFGLRFGPDDHLYAILCTDYLNPHPAPDPLGLRGAMLRISPDGKTVERFACGLRFAYDMAFNDRGDLFFSDNEGGDNPTEEINHAVRDGNYGHHPKMPKGPPLAPLLRITPHFSANGLEFNPAGNDFGGTAGDLFVSCWGPDGQWNVGALLRVRLTKGADGSYRAEQFPFAQGPGKVIDLAFGPSGDLYVAQFGTEGPAHTPFPGPMGAVYRFIHAPWLEPGDYTRSSEPAPAGVAQNGDPVRGRDLFARLACNTCHSITGRDEMVGPDLAAAWKALGRDVILESIREPSRSMKTGFETQIVTTTEDEELTGILVASDAKHISLRQAGNLQRTLPRESVISVRQSPTSIMPTNLLDSLAPAEVDDLLAYLKSLGKE